tara:strand:+ start:2 stop:1327 length:1326 start_codon:yes stop_codon:yes gene_type:complete
MKLFYALLLLFFLNNCSFDNKTGIWKNEDKISKKDQNLFKKFETLSSESQYYNKTVTLENSFKFNLTPPRENFEWSELFFNEKNNSINFSYNEKNEIIFKSRKLTRTDLRNQILFSNNNFIINDDKGNIISYSIDNEKITNKFNFYKKKFKNIKKTLNLILEDGIIYVSDNLGYLYAYDNINNKLIWAKNYKIPFRSNLKIIDNQLVTSNTNNDLYFFDKLNGDLLKMIPTEVITIKNKFINNLSVNNNELFFLNTYGSLYSIDKNTRRINWFLNLNRSLDLNPSNLFIGSKIINYDNKIVISSNFFTYIINASNGSIIHKMNFASKIKPVINNNFLFLISKKNFLISMNLNDGKLLYSYDINEKIAKFLKTKKKEVEFKDIVILNNKIFIFLKNSYLIKFNLNGSIEEIIKLPSKIYSQPVFIKNAIVYLNNNNRLIILD